jgi:hypothetical protein
MAANNLDFYNMCLEGIGKIKITDGKENNIYAGYYRSSFSSDYAEDNILKFTNLSCVF